jgi:hypothetical protein
MMTVLPNGGRQFSGWLDYLHQAEHGHNYAPKRTSRGSEASWTGTQSFEEAMQLARNGWPEGVQRMRRVADAISQVISSKIIRPEARFDETGDEVAVDRYLEGDPEHFVSYPLQESRASGGRVFTVGFGIFVSAGVDKEYFTNRGAAVLALLDALESAGYRCELDIGMAVREAYTMRCPIKAAEHALDLDRLAFTLMHPSIFRRIQFSIGETDPDGKRWGAHGGHYWSPDTSAHPIQQYDFWFPDLGMGTERPYATQDGALKHVLGMLKESGLVEIES